MVIWDTEQTATLRQTMDDFKWFMTVQVDLAHLKPPTTGPRELGLSPALNVETVNRWKTTLKKGRVWKLASQQ